MLQAGQRSRKSTWLPRTQSIVSAGHPPGPRLALVSLGALQVTDCCPETFLGTFHRQHLWKVQLVLTTAPSPHLGGHPWPDRASVPSPCTVTVLLCEGPPQSTAAPPKATGHPKLRCPTLKAWVGAASGEAAGVDQVAGPSPCDQCFLVPVTQH